MKRTFYCVCGSPMPPTSFKWWCENGHEFNNPQLMEGSENVMIATTESGIPVKFRSMISDGPPHLKSALEIAQGLAETREEGHIAPDQLEVKESSDLRRH